MKNLSILFIFFAISSAHAHPNHMTYENVKHDKVEQSSDIYKNSDTLIHKNMEKDMGHKQFLPCTEQYKDIPCQKKK